MPHHYTCQLSFSSQPRHDICFHMHRTYDETTSFVVVINFYKAPYDLHSPCTSVVVIAAVVASYYFPTTHQLIGLQHADLTFYLHT
jgi:hypothetical protein